MFKQNRYRLFNVLCWSWNIYKGAELSMDHFVKNFLFELKKGKKKEKKDRNPTIWVVTNIHTRFYIQIREYPNTRILAAVLLNVFVKFV